MYELTSVAYRFRESMAEGDFFAALGLTPGASRLDVDVAAARLADHAPEMAGKISTVANVLTHQKRRAVYEQLRAACDDAIAGLKARAGEYFEVVPSDYRRELWQRSCRLFRFELDRPDLAMGPDGTASLARRGADWIKEEFLEAHVPTLDLSDAERRRGRASRESWSLSYGCGATRTVFLKRRSGTTARTDRADASPAPIPDKFRADDYEAASLLCPRCKTGTFTAARYVDVFTFTFPPKTTPSDAVRAEGQRTGQVQFFFVNRRPAPPRDHTDLLERFYSLQEAGKDVTLEEAEAALDREEPPAAEILDIFRSLPELGAGDPRFTRLRPTRGSVRPATEGGQALKCLGALAFAVVAILLAVGLRTAKPGGGSTSRTRVTPAYQPPDFRPFDDYLETERQRARAALLRQALETDSPARRTVCEQLQQNLRGMHRGHHCEGNPCLRMREILEAERLLAEGRAAEAFEKYQALSGRQLDGR